MLKSNHIYQHMLKYIIIINGYYYLFKYTNI